VKGSLKLGMRRSRGSAFDLSRGPRISFWQSLAQRPHVVVAAVGTVALLGLSGSAIWMVLPDSSVERIVTRSNAAPAPLSEAPSTEVAEAATETAPARENTGSTVRQIAIGSTAAPEAEPSPLDQQDPRWHAKPAGDTAARAVARQANPSTQGTAEPAREAPASPANAFAQEDAGADRAQTAAIPLDVLRESAETVEEPAERQASAAGRAGTIRRAVNMRASPSSRGGVITVVPARSSVDVVSCKHWCEIVYKGRRGFVYRSFLDGKGG
jgi:hypothetical protein